MPEVEVYFLCSLLTPKLVPHCVSLQSRCHWPDLTCPLLSVPLLIPLPCTPAPHYPLQVGWVTGPAPLLAPVIKAHQFLVFTVPSSLQRAVAHGLDNEQDFYL